MDFLNCLAYQQKWWNCDGFFIELEQLIVHNVGKMRISYMYIVCVCWGYMSLEIIDFNQYEVLSCIKQLLLYIYTRDHS